MKLTVEFVGGFKDGVVLRTDSQEAWGYYHMTEEGAIGKKIKSMSDAALEELKEIMYVEDGVPKLRREPSMDRNHVYEVVAREQDGDELLVRFEYKGLWSPPA